MVAAVTGVVVAAAAAVLVLLVIVVVAVVVVVFVVVFIVVALLLVVARKLNANRRQAFVLTAKTSLTNPVAQDILQAIDCNGDRLSGEWDPLHLDMAVKCCEHNDCHAVVVSTNFRKQGLPP